MWFTKEIFIETTHNNIFRNFYTRVRFAFNPTQDTVELPSQYGFQSPSDPIFGRKVKLFSPLS